MPNHCENDLTLIGTAADVDRCIAERGGEKDDALGGPFPCADKIIPYPEPYRSQDKAAHDFEKEHPHGDWTKRPQDGFNRGGYDWCCGVWGTKWGCYSHKPPVRDDQYAKDVAEDIGPDEKQPTIVHRVSFESAWSPPLPVVMALSRQYPTIQFRLDYYESGCAYQGVYVACGGVELINVRCEYLGHRGG